MAMQPIGEENIRLKNLAARAESGICEFPRKIADEEQDELISKKNRIY